MLYKIAFEVDDGYSYTRDVALVVADNPDEAKEKLRYLINSIDNETCISEVFNMDVFDGSVFTGRHGCK